MNYSYTINNVKMDILIHLLKLSVLWPKIDTVSLTGSNNVVVKTKTTLFSHEQDLLTTICQQDYYNTSLHARRVIKPAIQNAIAFGFDLIAEYGSLNVFKNKSEASIERIVNKTAKLSVYLMSGSLKMALKEINLLEVDADITADEKAEMKRLLEVYLGIL